MDQVDCPICRGKLCLRWDSIEDPDSREQFSIERCDACGLGVTQPFPADLEPYYAQQYHGGRHGITASLCDRRRRRWVATLRGTSPNPRLLDIGCGDGTFLRAVQSDGWQVWGMEKYRTLAHQNGVTIYSSLAEAELTGPYDCITLWHVLEHLPNLNDSMATICRLLKPDGRIVISVPNSASLQARLFGRSWLHLDVPRHLFHFTEPSLKRLLSQHGLEVEGVSYSEFEYDLLGWVQSTFNRLGAEPNAIFKMLTGRPTNISLPGRCMHLLGAAILGTIGLLPTLFGNRSGFGGALVVTAHPISKSCQELQSV